METVENMCNCSIENIFQKSFALHTFTEKQIIMDNGRPMPILKITTKKDLYNRHFPENIYKNNFWIAGCKNLNKFYCWPCLLFSLEKTVWNKDGFNDLNNLHKAINRHSKSQNHLKSVLELTKFEKSRGVGTILDSQHRDNIIKHNSLVKKNRDIIKLLIDVVCFLGFQEQTFKEHFDDNESVNRGNYVELVNLLAKYNSDLCYHLETATVFSGLSKNIHKDLISSISETIIKEIKNEITHSKFVSIIYDEIIDISMKAQLSIILRFVDKDGNAQERFLGFYDVSENRSSLLNKFITEIISNFDCSSKVISQSHDGAPIMCGEQNGLQRNLCNNAIFIHCFAHRLNLTLTKSNSKIAESRKFFNTISSFSRLLSHYTKRSTTLDEKVPGRLPKIAPTCWNFNGSLIMTIKDYRIKIKELFEEIVDNQDSKWDSESINSARGLLVALNDFEFNFLLNFFSEIYPQTDILFDIFQTKQIDITYCIQTINEFVEQLENLRNGFRNIWNLTNEQCKLPNISRKNVFALTDEEYIEKYYLRIFIEILDNTKEEIKLRFDSLVNISFIELLDTTKYDTYSKSFPINLLANLKITYPSFFDFTALKVELTVLFNESELKNKNFKQIYCYIIENKLESAFEQFFILLNLVLTLPVTSASAEGNFCTLKRIKSYLKNKTNEDRLSNIALISIEKSLLKKLLLNHEIYEEIINDFGKKERRIELCYKL